MGETQGEAGVVVDEWQGCYPSRWKGLIVPQAFQHPARYSRPLIQRIYQHAISEGWLQAGQVCVDPFAGVGCGGLDAGLFGIHYLGVELEPRFCALANGAECGGDIAKHEACTDNTEHAPHHLTGNLELWQRKYGRLPQWVQPQVMQGDSRRLVEIVAGADCAIASPPYNLPMSQDHNGTRGGKRGANPSEQGAFARYGNTRGQLEGLPPGSVDAAIGSPAYTGNDKADYLLSPDGKTRRRDVKRGYHQGHGCFRGSETYGQSTGQMGAMATGTVDVCISSPPYENGCAHTGGADPQPQHILGGELQQVAYGKTDGQLGNTQGDTFWSAAKVILQQTYAILKPLGHAIWVLKGYVREGQIVDLPHQWQRLCEYVGFVTLHEHRALLVDSHSEMGLFGEAVEMYHNEYKSFFRRDNEQNGSPRIDWEIVLCMQKPAHEQGGVIETMIASRPYAASFHGQDEKISIAERIARTSRRSLGTTGRNSQINHPRGYGQTPGNLGGMPTGEPLGGEVEK